LDERRKGFPRNGKEGTLPEPRQFMPKKARIQTQIFSAVNAAGVGEIVKGGRNGPPFLLLGGALISACASSQNQTNTLDSR